MNQHTSLSRSLAVQAQVRASARRQILIDSIDRTLDRLDRTALGSMRERRASRARWAVIGLVLAVLVVCASSALRGCL